MPDVKRVAKRLLEAGMLVTVVGKPQVLPAKGRLKSRLYKLSAVTCREFCLRYIVAVRSAGTPNGLGRQAESLAFIWRCLMVAWPRGPPGGPHNCTVCCPNSEYLCSPSRTPALVLLL